MRYTKHLLAVWLVAMVWLFMFSGGVLVNEQEAVEAGPKNFFEMSIEELMEVEIVASKPENFFEMSIEELMEVEIATQADCAAVFLLAAV